MTDIDTIVARVRESIAADFVTRESLSQAVRQVESIDKTNTAACVRCNRAIADLYRQMGSEIDKYTDEMLRRLAAPAPAQPEANADGLTGWRAECKRAAAYGGKIEVRSPNGLQYLHQHGSWVDLGDPELASPWGEFIGDAAAVAALRAASPPKGVVEDKPAPTKALNICMNCGEPGPHYVPPSLGDPGFFHCEKKPAPPVADAAAEVAERMVNHGAGVVAITSPDQLLGYALTVYKPGSEVSAVDVWRRCVAAALRAATHAADRPRRWPEEKPDVHPRNYDIPYFVRLRTANWWQVGFFSSRGFWMDGRCVDDIVTHWLPQPPAPPADGKASRG